MSLSSSYAYRHDWDTRYTYLYVLSFSRKVYRIVTWNPFGTGPWVKVRNSKMFHQHFPTLKSYISDKF